MRGSELSAEHQKKCIADPVTQLPPGITMHLLSAPFHNAKTQKTCSGTSDRPMRYDNSRNTFRKASCHST